MVSACVICGSNNAYPKVSLHKFPKNAHPTIKEKWISYLKCYRVYKITENTKICSKHFKPRHMSKSIQRPRLTMSAWPSVHLRQAPVELPKQSNIEIINVGYEDIKLLYEGIIVEYVTYNKSNEFCGNSMTQHEVSTNHNNGLFYPRDINEEIVFDIKEESYGSTDIDIIKEEIGSPFSKDIKEEIDNENHYGYTDIDIIKEEIKSPFSNIINNFECKTKIIKLEDNALDIKVEYDST